MTRTLLLALVFAAACKPHASHDTTCRKFSDLISRCGGDTAREREEWVGRCKEAFEPDYGAKTRDDYAIVAPLGRETRSLALCAADAKDCEGLEKCFQQVEREEDQRRRELYR